MKQYDGAVFFVDILGVGALTRGHIRLDDDDYKAYEIITSKTKNHHYLCAKILIKFRSLLKKYANKDSGIDVAQLSDCAFIWGENPVQVADVARDFMWRAISSGILCRGGLGYGNVIEPDKVSRKIGKFILGEAVTKAVDAEKLGKGCRIFTDPTLASVVLSKIVSNTNAIEPLKNPLNSEIVDEFRWYLFPETIVENTFFRDMNSYHVRY